MEDTQVKNDYQDAKVIVAELKLNKQKTVTPADIPTFRRYLSLVAMKAAKEFVTKKMSDTDLLIIRVK